MNDKQIKILVIEDNPEDYILLEIALKRTNFFELDITCAKSFEEGVNHLRNHQVDIILLDLSLPDMWGLDGVKQLNHHASDIPIIVLTGHEDEAVALEAIQAGVQDYLLKGEFSNNLMMRAIYYAIARQRVTLKYKKLASHSRGGETCFKNMIEYIADGIVVVDKIGTIKFINPTAEKMYGRPAGDLIGTRFGYPLNIGESIEIELNQLRNTDQNISTEARVAKFMWQGEEAFLVSLRDITKRKNVKSKLYPNGDQLHQKEHA